MLTFDAMTADSIHTVMAMMSRTLHDHCQTTGEEETIAASYRGDKIAFSLVESKHDGWTGRWYVNNRRILAWVLVARYSQRTGNVQTTR